jgi:GNAT superfamily N-acetyltransferase
MPVEVRPAVREDVPALVRLRLANAERHVELAPDLHRIPDADDVRRYFEGSLSAGSNVVVLVAESGGQVIGMSELVILPEPPAHQILIPRRAAEIHTVVLGGHRGHGTGGVLVRAAEQAAADRGVVVIYAAIFAFNHGAARFYESAGFGPRGTLLRKELGQPSAG